jgi:hypothetical protein
MDSGRLSRSWFEGVVAGGLDVPRYVELVGVTSLTSGMDYFTRALGSRPFPLPTPFSGPPSQHRPTGAKTGTGWVPMIAPEDAVEAESDLYVGSFVPNIVRALSLVPDEVRALRVSSAAHYLPVVKTDDGSAPRAIDRTQIELVAARVSALNQCFY